MRIEKTDAQVTDSIESAKRCTKRLLPVTDVLELTSGKWRLHIIMALMSTEGLRFNEIKNVLSGISGKVLSKNLKDLEMNMIVTRTIYETFPITVEYKLTEYGKTLEGVVDALYEWGMNHRNKIMSQES